jgi:hypothetical protein
VIYCPPDSTTPCGIYRNPGEPGVNRTIDRTVGRTIARMVRAHVDGRWTAPTDEFRGNRFGLGCVVVKADV